MKFRGDLDIFILAVLQAGPLHGYDIAKEIRTQSEECLKFGEGQIYPALHRLEERKRVESQWVAQEGKPAKKVYSMTKEGEKALENGRGEWKDFSAGVTAVLNLSALEAVHGK